MIISCPCDKKKFEIDASMIPNEGRNLQCGFCGHVWFYRKNIIENKEPINEIKKKEITLPSKKKLCSAVCVVHLCVRVSHCVLLNTCFWLNASPK